MVECRAYTQPHQFHYPSICARTRIRHLRVVCPPFVSAGARQGGAGAGVSHTVCLTRVALSSERRLATQSSGQSFQFDERHAVAAVRVRARRVRPDRAAAAFFEPLAHAVLAEEQPRSSGGAADAKQEPVRAGAAGEKRAERTRAPRGRTRREREHAERNRAATAEGGGRQHSEENEAR